MDRKIYQRQKDRKRRRELEKRRKKLFRGIVGVFLSFCLVLGIFVFVNGKEDNPNRIAAKASTSKRAFEKSREQIDREVEEKEKDLNISFVSGEEGEEMERAQEKRAVSTKFEGYGEKLQGFVQVSRKTPLKSKPNAGSKDLRELEEGTYLEVYGLENDWLRIRNELEYGFVRVQDVRTIGDPNLCKVVDGVVIVNKKYGLPAGYTTDVDPNAESALRIMLEAMERDGLSVEVGTRYRTAEEEAEALQYKTEKTVNAPEPGHSEFQTGLAVEFYVAGTDPRVENHFEETPQAQWLYRNAYKYGFILRYPEGSENITGYRANAEIFRYVGTDLATKIAESGLVLEEYLQVR